MRRHFTRTLRGALAALLLAGAASAAANTALLEFDNPEQESLYQGLVRELRCTVCQNQNLLDSNSSLAQDLREKVYDQVRNGATREAVIDFMVSRYGDFVLYRPPLKAETMLLWFGPLLFLLCGGAVLAYVLRQQKNRALEPVPAPEPPAAQADDTKPNRKKRRRGK